MSKEKENKQDSEQDYAHEKRNFLGSIQSKQVRGRGKQAKVKMSMAKSGR